VKTHPHNSGFVLLLVLMVLTIAATLLTATARRSGGRMLEARERSRGLRLAWGLRSCRAFCMPAAERLLTEAESDADAPLTRTGRSITLGDLRFDLTITDEQAKANVNLLAHHRGDESLTAALQAMRVDSRNPLPIRLRPAKNGRDRRTISKLPQTYGSYDQLLRFSHPSQLIGGGPGEVPAVSRITCWGSGHVNLKRVEPMVLRQALAGLMTETQIDRLIDYREENRDCTLGEMLGYLEFSHGRIKKLTDSFVTDTSKCHSLWIVARGPTRSWHRLYVQQAGDARNDAQHWTFAW